MYSSMETAKCLPSDFRPISKSASQQLAKKTGRTKSFYAREAILTHLEDLEDLYLAQKALGGGGRAHSARRYYEGVRVDGQKVTRVWQHMIPAARPSPI